MDPPLGQAIAGLASPAVAEPTMPAQLLDRIEPGIGEDVKIGRVRRLVLPGAFGHSCRTSRHRRLAVLFAGDVVFLRSYGRSGRSCGVAIGVFLPGCLHVEADTSPAVLLAGNVMLLALRERSSGCGSRAPVDSCGLRPGTDRRHRRGSGSDHPDPWCRPVPDIGIGSIFGGAGSPLRNSLRVFLHSSLVQPKYLPKRPERSSINEPHLSHSMVGPS